MHVTGNMAFGSKNMDFWKFWILDSKELRLHKVLMN